MLSLHLTIVLGVERLSQRSCVALSFSSYLGRPRMASYSPFPSLFSKSFFLARVEFLILPRVWRRLIISFLLYLSSSRFPTPSVYHAEGNESLSPPKKKVVEREIVSSRPQSLPVLSFSPHVSYRFCPQVAHSVGLSFCKLRTLCNMLFHRSSGLFSLRLNLPSPAVTG